MTIFTKQLFQYMSVGFVATVIDLTIFSFLVYVLKWDYIFAILCSFFIATGINFFLCKTFVFKPKDISFWKAGIKHYGASGWNLLLNQVGMLILISGFGFPHLVLGRILIITSTFFLNFMMVRRFVFGVKSE